MPPDRRMKLRLWSKKRNKLSEPYDVVLIAGIDNVRLSAHWNVISRWSPVFEEAFNSNLTEVNSGEIELERIDGRTLKAILAYMYNVPTELYCEMVERVLVAAHYLQIKKLVKVCLDFMLENLRTTNCLHKYLFSEQHLYLPLRNKTYAHFEEVCTRKKTFLQLTEEQLVKFISDDCRYFRSEEKLFLSLVAWVEHDKRNRENHINFHRLKIEFIDEHRHLVPQTEYLDGWTRWLEASQSKGDTSLVQVNDIKTRQTNMLVRVGADDSFEFHTFNPELGIWFAEKWPHSNLSMNSMTCVAVVNKKLLVSNLLHFKWLDLETMRWTKLQENSFHSYKREIFESKGELYIIGDFRRSGLFPVHLLENDVLIKYDFSTNQWKWVKEWPLKVECVTAHDGLIYASGAKNGSNLLQSYDPTADKFTSIALSESQNFIHAMAGIGEYLYLVVNWHNTRIDRYHPSTKSWTEIGLIGHNFLISNARCVVFNKRLLIFEQNHNEPYSEMIVKEYNPTKLPPGHRYQKAQYYLQYKINYTSLAA